MELQVVNFLSEKRKVPGGKKYKRELSNFARLDIDDISDPSRAEKSSSRKERKPMSARTPRPQTIKKREIETQKQPEADKNLKPLAKKRVDNHILETVICERHAEMIEEENKIPKSARTVKIDRRNLPPETKASKKEHRVFYWGV